MTDRDFESWMQRLGAEEVAEPSAVPESAAIWWRAQLRRRMENRTRATRPLRVAERLAGVVCFAAAVAVGAHVGVASVAPFIVVTLVAGAGAAALVLRGAAE
jgi:hypothetical protein